jgi:hypothetical protein
MAIWDVKNRIDKRPMVISPCNMAAHVTGRATPVNYSCDVSSTNHGVKSAATALPNPLHATQMAGRQNDFSEHLPENTN